MIFSDGPMPTPRLAATAICMALVAMPAAADLTPAQVWGDWRSYVEGFGYDVTASETLSGDTLTITGIAVRMGASADVEAMTLSIGDLQFAPRGDGTVEVVMPATLPVMLDVVPTGAEPPVKLTMDFTQTGQSMIASGTADAMQYDYTADSFGFALTGLNAEDQSFVPQATRFALTASDVASQTTVAVGETRDYAQNISIGAMVYDVFFKNPEGPEGMTLNTTLRNQTFTGTSSVPTADVSDAQDLTPMLEAGFAVDGTFDITGAETRLEIMSEEGTSRIKTASETSTLGVKVDAAGVAYDLAATGVQVGGQLAGLPFPLFAEMAGSGFNLQMPVMRAQDPQDFALGFDMTGFTMSDVIWALFDPSAQLPRDPATIALDLRGKARMLFNPLDSDAVTGLATNATTPPGELTALTIDRLTVDAAGASLNAKGDMIFDTQGPALAPGLPAPIGDINIDLAGANALMDRLVAMGLLPPDQVMGARLMLGLFAVPGEAPDTLKSTIAFGEGGEISANGQRIR